ncbi:MAG: hypothetical protein R2831_05715 [Chitinophagaceae bacterium]
MNKLFILLLVSAVFSFTSCNQYRSISSVTKLSQLSGNPFMYQLSKSMLKNIGNYMIQKGIQSTVGKANLLSPLSGLFSKADDIAGLKNLLSTAYGIAPKKLDAGYGNLGNVKDLIGFVAKNGTNFRFY